MPLSVLLLAACQALMMSGNTLLLTSSAIAAQAISQNPGLVTLPLALQFFATMLSTIPASLLMGRIGRRRGFLFAHLFALAGALVGGLALHFGSFTLFCLAGVLVGAYNGFGVYYRFAAAEAVEEARRSRAISAVMVGGVIAALLGPNLANWSRYLLEVPFLGSFVCLALLYLLSLGILLLCPLPHRPADAEQAPGRPLGQIVGQPRFLVALCCGMIGYGVMSLIMTATPLAMEGHQHPFADTAFVIQWHVLGMFAPAFFTGHLIARLGVLPVMAVGALAELACALINLSGQGLVHYWSALFLLGLGWNFLFIGATTLLTQTYQPAERAKVQALNDFMIFSTVTAASLGAGLLQQRLGWQWVNLAMLPMLGLVALALLWLAWAQRSRA